MSFAPQLFDGKRVLVTGGTSGIGAHTALYFATLGAQVVALGLNSDGDQAPRHERIERVECNVTDAPLLAKIISDQPSLYVLVNGAGISRHRDEYKLDVFEQVISINLISTMRASENARPLLAKTSGSIVNVGSMYSFFGSQERPAYSASKGGIAQLTRSLAQAYAGEGIRVNAVAPGWIDTPLSAGLMADPVASGAILGRTPLKRWGQSQEVAQAIAFLASPAASFITGVMLPVDGGYLTA